jgi:hypothetical protein
LQHKILINDKDKDNEKHSFTGSHDAAYSNAHRTVGMGNYEAHEFILNFDGESTGISPTTNSSLNGGEWYDLQGRRLSGQPTAKGVYIHNNKTVVIK